MHRLISSCLVIWASLLPQLVSAQSPSDSEQTRQAIGSAKRGDFDKAIFQFTEAIRTDSKPAGAYLGRGMVWISKGRLDKAESDLSEAIKADPKLTPAYLHRGSIWAKAGDYDAAIADFMEAIVLDPQSTQALIKCGSAWKEREEYERPSLDPRQSGESELVSLYYTKAIAIQPSAEVYHLRARFFNEGHKFDEAISDCNEALFLNSADARAYCERAYALQEKGQYSAAIADYARSTSLNPGDAAAWHDFAAIYATCKDTSIRSGSKAVEYATKSCQLSGWKNARFIQMLADAHAEAGDSEKARESEKKADALIDASSPGSASKVPGRYKGHIGDYEATIDFRSDFTFVVSGNIEGKGTWKLRKDGTLINIIMDTSTSHYEGQFMKGPMSGSRRIKGQSGWEHWFCLPDGI